MMYPESISERNESKHGRLPRHSADLDLSADAAPCDQMLVVRAQSGEHGAFNALVRKYRQRVMKLSMRYMGNRDDAEDVVQITFINAYWGLQNFRGESAFYSWLHRVAINSAKTMLSLGARNASVLASNRREAEHTDHSFTALTDLDTPEELALTDEHRRRARTIAYGCRT